MVSTVLLLLIAPGLQAADSSLDLGKYKGKAVYLDFWASWCVPCKKSFPWMQEMQAKYGDRGLQIVAVNLDENPKDADRFLARFPDINFTIVRDPKGKYAESYQVSGMPTALLFDAEGNEAGRHVGFRSAKKITYEATIRALLPRTEGASK
ncbi:MAG TPA: TlpA family protein disulfide reductase [Gammaproteobacteria bacterium]|nr:TlpA family protein disulfide reductase [Gammaproteobacteria bacterium]